MKKYGILVCLALSPLMHAQIVNIENRRVYDDTAGWYGDLQGSFSLIQNQNYLFRLNLRSKVQYKSKKHYWLFLQDYVYSGGETVYANSGMGHLRYAYRFKHERLKAESYLQAQYNAIRRQRIRSLIGSGLRYKFINLENSKFFFGSSLFFEYEELQPEAEFNQDLRWNSYLSWYIKRKLFTFTGTSYYQPLTANFKDFRFAGQYALLSKISKRLSFKSEFDFFYDSRPPVGLNKTAFTLSFGLSMEFGK